MKELAYGEGIKILSQAEALTNLLAKAKTALILADQLEPKIEELSRVKSGLVVEVEELEQQRVAIIAATEKEKQEVVAQRESELAAMQVKVNEKSAKAQQGLQTILDQIDARIKVKAEELEALESRYKEQKALLDSEILNKEKQLKDAQDALEKLRILTKE